ncbi:hypothetical protein [Paenibacillus silvae]|uniref:hypothetical protein n=1 Tax=Paenibacillus silvae TaxID=1325358 RepID=UPI000FC0144D|nr:hypothetical protein [Paenibacillus silvae]
MMHDILLSRYPNVKQVIQIMNRIKHAHPDVQKEWLRRLEWTLQTNFGVNNMNLSVFTG